MLVDEWTELVPSREETTGIAFQYDPPDASAPQAILLAVPPVVGEPWTVGGLNRVLLETLDLARIRAVDPALLGDVAHFLPATYLAFNAHGDAVSSDLNLLTADLAGEADAVDHHLVADRAADVGPERRATATPPACTTRCGCSAGSGRSGSSRARTPARRSWPAGAPGCRR